MTKLFASEILELSENQNNFDAELFAEWYIQGQITDGHIAALSEADFIAVEKDITERWGEKHADKFGDLWIELS